ncbi:sensor histidine kinase [Cupriavidus basilensis]
MLMKTEVTKARVDVGGTINETLSLLAGELVKHRVDVAVDVAPELYIAADKIQIQQVLINLIVNGIEAMKDISDRDRRLVLRSQGDEKIVSIFVKDVGVGLPAHDTSQVFEAFYSTKPDGMGMGLSICRTIVQSHGGTLEALRNESVGATFRLSLPAFQS